MFKKLLMALGVLVVLAVGGIGYLFISGQEAGEAASEMSGTKAPELQVYTLTDSGVRLSDLKGKPVFLNFWATWCPPCVGEMPNFEALYPQYKDKVQFVAVSVDDKRADVEKFVKEKGFTFPIYWDKDKAANKGYGIQAIPASYLIDAQGNIIDGHVGAMSEAQLKEFLDKAQ